ncbi:lysophospholipid acyltransferase family protein [Nostoc sp. NIES-2111]
MDRFFDLLLRLGRHLPPPLPYALLRCALAFFAHRRQDLRERTLENLRLAGIPEPEQTLLKLKRSAAQHFAQLLCLRASSDAAARWQVVGGEHFLEARRSGRAIVLAFFHTGFWEEALHILAVQGIQALILQQSFPQFPRLAIELQARRALSGHHFLEWRQGGREMFRHLRSGGVALLAADLFPRSGGFRMPWFGRDTWVDDKAARAAQLTGAVLLPVWAEENIAHIEAPIDTADARRATMELMQLGERIIREHPHLWIWPIRRWREKEQ